MEELICVYCANSIDTFGVSKCVINKFPFYRSCGWFSDVDSAEKIRRAQRIREEKETVKNFEKRRMEKAMEEDARIREYQEKIREMQDRIEAIRRENAFAEQEKQCEENEKSYQWWSFERGKEILKAHQEEKERQLAQPQRNWD